MTLRPGGRETEPKEDVKRYITLDDLYNVLKKKFSQSFMRGLMGEVGEYACSNPEEGQLGVTEETADKLLAETARRVFVCSLTDLPTLKLREIEYIRKELGFTEKFNPSI